MLIGIMCVWNVALSQESVLGRKHEVSREDEMASQKISEEEKTTKIDLSMGEHRESKVNLQSVKTTTLDCLIEPHMSVDVATAISGIVKEISVDRGDLIKSKQVIANLEDEVEKADLAQAKARMDLASRKFKRLETLSKKEMIASEKLDEAKSEYELAKAEFQKASALLDQRTILSPFDGVIVERYVVQGELVDKNKIVKMAQINPLNVEIVAPVSMLGQFMKGAIINIYPEGPNTGPYDARVARIDRVVDAASGMFRVRLSLPNPDYSIVAGVRCKAEYSHSSTKN